MIDWEYIKKQREENKGNPNYPDVRWFDYERKLLYVKVGDFEKKGISVEDARQMFKDNDLFNAELDCLLVPKPKEYIIDNTNKEENKYNSNYSHVSNDKGIEQSTTKVIPEQKIMQKIHEEKVTIIEKDETKDSNSKIDWKYIEKQREENKDNPNYPHVYWTDSVRGLLYVKVGDFEQDRMPVEDARQMFKNNDLFKAELDYLLKSKTKNRKRENLKQSKSSPSTVIKKDISIEKAKEEIETEISKIISELELQKSDNVMTQLKNCCLVQKYIVEQNNYNEDIMSEKENMSEDEIVILDLYNAVVLHSGVCTSNSLMFKKILEKVGVKSEVVGLISNEKGGHHASNIVELDGEYYFFDSTLESSIYHANSKDGNIILCCAGLGKNEYCQFYTPKVVLPDSATDDVKPLPENISEYRIPQSIVNSFIINGHQQQMKH